MKKETNENKGLIAELQETEKFISEMPCLFNNKTNLIPSLYSSLKFTVLPSLKLKLPDNKAKQIVYRSLFKNCYSNIEDDRFMRKLSIFHTHFKDLISNVYPFTNLKQTFPEKFEAAEKTAKEDMEKIETLRKSACDLPVIPVKRNRNKRFLSNTKVRSPKQL